MTRDTEMTIQELYEFLNFITKYTLKQKRRIDENDYLS